MGDKQLFRCSAKGTIAGLSVPDGDVGIKVGFLHQVFLGPRRFMLLILFYFTCIPGLGIRI